VDLVVIDNDNDNVHDDGELLRAAAKFPGKV
jgi:hypothetical protein